ncbi:Tn3 family transposase [Paraburkholderia sp. LEh10]|uniref:Tn3 family transposase n=1 Tax=Paraburkholderia sp. LEh10 TaxID=2821353 RepID=UPI0028A71CF5|nr:Tn3 family transposase [Paraburkholderia sp. LEh10]
MSFNLTVFGAYEYESHYVFNVLYNDISNIRPRLHPTDTYGPNHANYWTRYAFGYQFAPRYRDFHKKLGGLDGRRRDAGRVYRRAVLVTDLRTWPHPTLVLQDVHLHVLPASR